MSEGAVAGVFRGDEVRPGGPAYPEAQRAVFTALSGLSLHQSCRGL